MLAADFRDVAVEEEAGVVVGGSGRGVAAGFSRGGGVGGGFGVAEIVVVGDLFQPLEDEVPPHGALPGSVDAVGVCASMNINRAVQFRHAELFPPGDNWVGQRFE